MRSSPISVDIIVHTKAEVNEPSFLAGYGNIFSQTSQSMGVNRLKSAELSSSPSIVVFYSSVFSAKQPVAFAALLTVSYTGAIMRRAEDVRKARANAKGDWSSPDATRMEPLKRGFVNMMSSTLTLTTGFPADVVDVVCFQRGGASL